MNMKNPLYLFLLLFWAISAQGQKKIDSLDTGKRFRQTYEKLLGKVQSQQGLFNYKYADGKHYFEIPDSVMKRSLLVITRFVSTPQGFGLFGGEKANEQTLYFEKQGADKVFLKAALFLQETKDSTQAIYKALATSQEDPIVAVFDIKAINPQTNNVVIEVGDFFRKDNAVVSISSQVKSEKKLSSIADDRSFVQKISVYPINAEIKTVKTYSSSGTQFAAQRETGAVTIAMNTSIVLLPKVPMQKRFFDERVGFFSNRILQFDENKQRSQTRYFIQRYRLEPKDKDIEKYKKGELVEPKKQIVYYIDPATPKKWRKYLILGVNDWQKAFEQAGFKNAIVAKEWPEKDTTMSLEDARFSVIRYYASETPNAYGPRISDPRSGEIIESHVGWYHNVMKLVHNWYMVQAGALDPRARKMEFDDELMGQLIRFVSSHEIGHTIGLRHNMGASYATPVELLRNKKWVEANGHTVSIMDYARFNYVAQPEDKISPAGIYPRIGVYDKWAIEWGYKNFYKGKQLIEEPLKQSAMVDERLKDRRLWFGGEGKDGDPRSKTEDLSDNVMKANAYGILNLKRVIKGLPEWTKEDGDKYDNLKELHKALTSQYHRYLYHVIGYFASDYRTIKSIRQAGDVYENVPKSKVKEALAYVDQQLFNAPLWLFPQEINSKIGTDPLKAISEWQGGVLNIFLSPTFLYNISKPTLGVDRYPVSEFLTDLEKMVWHSSANPTEAALLRAAQRIYLEKFNACLTGSGFKAAVALEGDARLEMKAYAAVLKQHLAAQESSSALNALHIKECVAYLDKMLDDKKDNK